MRLATNNKIVVWPQIALSFLLGVIKFSTTERTKNPTTNQIAVIENPSYLDLTIPALMSTIKAKKKDDNLNYPL